MIFTFMSHITVQCLSSSRARRCHRLQSSEGSTCCQRPEITAPSQWYTLTLLHDRFIPSFLLSRCSKIEVQGLSPQRHLSKQKQPPPWIEGYPPQPTTTASCIQLEHDGTSLSWNIALEVIHSISTPRTVVEHGEV